MKIDLHVHSKYSSKPSEWILQKLKCPESFTEPYDLYQIAKRRGMTHVTITDHNSIDGSLEIAHLPNTFISCEFTTYFPEDGCKIHVLVYGLNETQFEVCQKIRRNIYDLVDYLVREKLTYAVAHPLFAINGKLTYNHFEKLLLLFDTLELNGSRNERLNEVLKLICSNLTPELIAELMEKHRLVSPLTAPWKKSYIGGSDDHSSIHIAIRHTEVEEAYDVQGYLQGIREGRARVNGAPATPQGFARTLYSIAYQFYRNKLNFDKGRPDGVITNVLNRFLLPETEKTVKSFSFKERIKFLWDRSNKSGRVSPESQDSIFEHFKYEVFQLIDNDPKFLEVFNKGMESDPNQHWYEVICILSNKILSKFNTHQLRSLFQARFFEVIQSVGSAAMLYFILAPYFLAFSLFSKDLQFSRNILRRFAKKLNKPEWVKEEPLSVAHFTDTLYDPNGVARTILRQVESSRELGKKYQVVTCDNEKRVFVPEIKNFHPIATFKFEEYRDQKFFYPPFLEMLGYSYEQQFTHIHTSTPGPVGLAALGIANILKTPLVGTYHTAFPQYMQYFTEDNAMEGMAWKYMIWYYQQMQLVLVPSESTRADLVQRGLVPDKIRMFPRGVNPQKFTPAKRNGYFEKHNLGNTLKLLYAGRISKEKNMPILMETFRELCKKRQDISLIIAGKGPYFDEMRAEAKDLPCLFLGHLEEEDLSKVYASCDLFVFPSTTDTFGNVVLEAQASGIPVIVTNCGGPQENLLPGETGLIVDLNEPHSLLNAIEELTANTHRLRAMGEAARRYSETRSFQACFERTWSLYQEARLTDDELFPQDNAHIPDMIAKRLINPDLTVA